MKKINKCCGTCALLDKETKREYNGAYQYGCKANIKYQWSKYNTGYIPCWITSDELLKDLHAGKCWMPIVENPKQLEIEDFLSK